MGRAREEKGSRGGGQRQDHWGPAGYVKDMGLCPKSNGKQPRGLSRAGADELGILDPFFHLSQKESAVGSPDGLSQASPHLPGSVQLKKDLV